MQSCAGAPTFAALDVVTGPGGPANMISLTIERLRGDAEGRLAWIADEFGPTSLLARQCERVWLLAEGQAVLSVLHGDEQNARVILETALGLLERAPEVARRAELSAEELSSLMRQAV